MSDLYPEMPRIHLPGSALNAPLGHIPQRRLPIGIRVADKMLILTIPHRRNQRYTSPMKDTSSLLLYGDQVKQVQIDFAGPAVFASQEDYYATVRSMKELIRGLNTLKGVQMVSVTAMLKEFDCDPLATQRLALLGALHGLELPWSVRYLIDAQSPSKETKVSEERIKEKLAKSWKLSFMNTLRSDAFPAFFDPYPSDSYWSTDSYSNSSATSDTTVESPECVDYPVLQLRQQSASLW
jgi:hypothetical protein